MRDHEHFWDRWVGYDDHVIEAGMTDGYCYWRECRYSGCNVRERAKALQAVGETQIQEPKKNADP